MYTAQLSNPSYIQTEEHQREEEENFQNERRDSNPTVIFRRWDVPLWVLDYGTQSTHNKILRKDLNNTESFEKNISGADFRQSEVNRPETSDLSTLSFLTTALTRSVSKSLIVSMASAVLAATLLCIRLITSWSTSSCLFHFDSFYLLDLNFYML